MRLGRRVRFGLLSVGQGVYLLVVVYGPMIAMTAWLGVMVTAVFFYRDAPEIPYCATADRMERAAARELLLLVAGALLLPLLAGWLLAQSRQVRQVLLAVGCVALSAIAWVALGLLGIVTADRMFEAVRGVIDPPQATISPEAVPDLCRQIYPEWGDVVDPRQ